MLRRKCPSALAKEACAAPELGEPTDSSANARAQRRAAELARARARELRAPPGTPRSSVQPGLVRFGGQGQPKNNPDELQAAFYVLPHVEARCSRDMQGSKRAKPKFNQ